MPSFALGFGVVLVVLGAVLAVFERRVLRRLAELRNDAPAEVRNGRFLRERSIRRLKIGLWILLLGMTVVAGETVDAHVHPLLYMSCWCAAALIAVALVRLAAIDYFALRRHWAGELLRTTTDLERVRSELRRHLGPDAETPKN